ncbi:permease-like cell division protein FtsX [Paractinoplanes atraurantiacus]|uniref:permease-like cell division protein FtsX n=1 Tax=Paractinoplanes atraurantiacus TaxID=1036182 RepID=UPI00117778FF|nr:permease-like cell division protein FtsX [Actinoplanes atraurantiacus]
MTEPEAPSTPRSSRPVLIAVAVLIALVGILAGAGGGVGYLLYAGFRKPVERSYDISVFLKSEVTEAQKTAVRDQLERAPHQGEVKFESRAQALARFKELWKDDPEFVNQVGPNSLPESYRFTWRGATFDCEPLAAVRKLPGVNDLVIVMYPTKNEPAGSIRC